jgi:DNA-binding CsgD family transcriptional regulator
MTRRISKEGRLSDYDPDVGALWRSRNDELPQEVFDSLPAWMETEPVDQDYITDVQNVFTKVIETLTKREQILLWYRFWANYTLEEISDLFEVTRERVRQIEQKSLRKMRHPTRSESLLPFVDICPFKDRKERKKLEEYNIQWEADNKELLERYIRYMEKRASEKLLKLNNEALVSLKEEEK